MKKKEDFELDLYFRKQRQLLVRNCRKEKGAILKLEMLHLPMILEFFRHPQVQKTGDESIHFFFFFWEHR